MIAALINVLGNEWTRMATHLVTLYCFEQLAEWDLVMTHHHIVEAMSKLIIVIFHYTQGIKTLDNPRKSNGMATGSEGQL